MKKDNVTKELSDAVEALLFTIKEFYKTLNGHVTEQSELLKIYYLFATKLIDHIQAIDSISLTIGEQIQTADRQNQANKITRLGADLDASVTIRRLCEEFLSNAERDIEVKQMELTRLKGYVELFSRKLLMCKESLSS